MFSSKSIILLLLISDSVYDCLGESSSNIHVLKDQISKILGNCGDSKDVRQEAKEEFERRASSVVRIERQTKNKSYDDDGNYDKETDDNNSEEDYGDFYRNQGKSNRRRDHRYNSSNSWQNQNDSRQYRQNDRRYSPEYRSVKDLNFTANLYDPFMTRGIRSIRDKRFDRLTKNSNDDECLSQCIFSQLQIIDDRGIPKESLFMKLVEDNISSQQSKVILQGQIQTCFRELVSESEENSCSYSNALERCLNLQLKKRKSIADEANLNQKDT